MTRDARKLSTEIRDRKRVMREILERLPHALAAGETQLRGGPSKTTVLWTTKNQLVASFQDSHVAQFLLDAPVYLRVFMDYMDQLESSAFYDRKDRRQAEKRLAEIEDELLAAEHLGIHSKDGQRRVRSAIAAVKDKRRYDDWDDDI